jgi:hypothetical protein
MKQRMANRYFSVATITPAPPHSTPPAKGRKTKISSMSSGTLPCASQNSFATLEHSSSTRLLYHVCGIPETWKWFVGVRHHERQSQCLSALPKSPNPLSAGAKPPTKRRLDSEDGLRFHQDSRWTLTVLSTLR